MKTMFLIKIIDLSFVLLYHQIFDSLDKIFVIISEMFLIESKK